MHSFALMATPPEQAPKLIWETGNCRYTAQAKTSEPSVSDDLFRVGMKRRFEETPSRSQRKLALKYQLISEKTSFILTYVRDSNDKASGIPRVHQVPAHGHGLACAGSVISAPPSDGMCDFAPSSPIRSADYSPIRDDFSKEIQEDAKSLLDLWHDGICFTSAVE